MIIVDVEDEIVVILMIENMIENVAILMIENVVIVQSLQVEMF